MSSIKSITAPEILDSRGNPTVMVTVTLSDSITASACVPSSASTEVRKAMEFADNDPQRYGGKGVRNAEANVNMLIAPKLKGLSAQDQTGMILLWSEWVKTYRSGQGADGRP